MSIFEASKKPLNANEIDERFTSGIISGVAGSMLAGIMVYLGSNNPYYGLAAGISLLMVLLIIIAIGTMITQAILNLKAGN